MVPLPQRRSMFTLPRKWRSWIPLPKLEKLTNTSLPTHPGTNRSLTKSLSTETPFEIRPSPNKGLGIFATSPIPCGTTIMNDPLIFRFSMREKDEHVYHRFTQRPPSVQSAILALSVSQNPNKLSGPAGKKIIEEHIQAQASHQTTGVISALEDKNRIMLEIFHVYDILVTNAFEPAGLFLTASRLNHSCVPNADHYFDAETQCEVVFANRDLRPGEEIFVSYIKHTSLRGLRALELNHRWGFACDCPACDERHPESAVKSHEEYLERLHVLSLDQDLDGEGRLEASAQSEPKVLENVAKRVKERIELVMGHHSFKKLARQAYLVASDIALAQYRLGGGPGKLEKAIEMVERVVELDVLYEGAISVVAKEHRALLLGLREQQS